MGVHGYPRATGDIDIWVDASIENAEKLYGVLAEFGVPLSDINERTFAHKGIILQIGIAPRRIDMTTHIDGVEFREAYDTRKIVEIEGLEIPFISKESLIRNKRATGREKDALDARRLAEEAGGS